MSLVLTLRVDKSIVLKSGEHEITVRLTDIERNQVRLAFDAPLEVQILRDKLVRTKSPNKFHGA